MEEKVICNVCGREFDIDDTVKINGKVECLDCYSENDWIWWDEEKGEYYYAND